jgi:DNA polymerase III gamma/tau subunit
MLTNEQIESDIVSYLAFKITYYDEFQRVKIPAQEMLLKALEGDPYPLNKLFIFSTKEPEKVDGGLLQRVTHLKLIPPTVEQLIPWLEKICNWAPIHVEDKTALGLIAEDCNRIPRVCLNFLFDHCILEGQSISKKIVERATRIDAIGREKITAHTKF